MRKISTRISDNWLVLTHLKGRTWRLQVWGDTPLEAEVIAEDEAAAKECALTATMERLQIEPSQEACRRIPDWNTVITSRWDSRLQQF
jgi:hypothetical protein